MPAEDVLYRVTSAGTGISPNHPGFRKALCEMQAAPLTVFDNASDLADILAIIRTAARKDGTCIAVVDYLQLVEAKADSRELAMSEIARRLKAVAQAENIACATASQLNDNGQLRESRAIGHHANLVLGIGDDGLSCKKFRRGPMGWTIPAELHGPTSRFIAK
jgi:replicative DNA helicase